jgi:hypothetical protein
MFPKKDLVTGLQVVLQGRRSQIARSLPEAATLVRELSSFQVKASAATEELVPWREGTHDDLVLAAAEAAWIW